MNKSYQRDDGTWEVNADFSNEEMNVIIDVGINTLLDAGALPFTTDDKQVNVVIPPSKLKQ